MSKRTNQFFEKLKAGEQVTFVDAIKQAASSLRGIGGQIWDGAKPMVDHGRAEMAALLYTGQAHVMYMKGQEGGEKSPVQEPVNEVSERQRDDGREM